MLLDRDGQLSVCFDYPIAFVVHAGDDGTDIGFKLKINEIPITGQKFYFNGDDDEKFTLGKYGGCSSFRYYLGDDFGSSRVLSYCRLMCGYQEKGCDTDYERAIRMSGLQLHRETADLTEVLSKY